MPPAKLGRVISGCGGRPVGRHGRRLVLALCLTGWTIPAWSSGSQTLAATNGASSSPATNGTALGSGTNNLADDNLAIDQMNRLDDKYKLAIGDRLSFRITEDEDDPKTILVTDSGEIDVPYIGRFSAVGKTCRELAWQLKGELEKNYYYRATVIISVDAVITRGTVYLVGPVHAPGPLEIPRDETLTLSKAIMRAGGFTDLADQKQVRVTREGKDGAKDRQTFIINVADILNRGIADKDMVLLPGDVIYIPERLLRF